MKYVQLMLVALAVVGCSKATPEQLNQMKAVQTYRDELYENKVTMKVVILESKDQYYDAVKFCVDGVWYLRVRDSVTVMYEPNGKPLACE